MKYGINLLLWGANIGEGHYPLLEKIKAWGFDGVEIPTFGPDEPRYKKLGQKLKDIGLQCTTCVIVRKETNPLDPSPAVRQAARRFPQADGRPQPHRRLDHDDGPLQLAGRHAGRPRADGRRMEAGRRGLPEGRAVRPAGRRADGAGIPQPLRALLHQRHRHGRQVRRRGEPPELPAPLRHLPFEHRGEGHRRLRSAPAASGSSTSTSPRTTAPPPAKDTSAGTRASRPWPRSATTAGS